MCDPVHTEEDISLLSEANVRSVLRHGDLHVSDALLAENADTSRSVGEQTDWRASIERSKRRFGATGFPSGTERLENGVGLVE